MASATIASLGTDFFDTGRHRHRTVADSRRCPIQRYRQGLTSADAIFDVFNPCGFPMPKAGIAATIYSINPLTPIILTARDWLTGLPTTIFPGIYHVNILALILLTAVWIVFRLAMPILIERMSS
jgi:hypothetical protein